MEPEELRQLYVPYLEALSEAKLTLKQLRSGMWVGRWALGEGLVGFRLESVAVMAAAFWYDRHDLCDDLEALGRFGVVRYEGDFVEPLPDTRGWTCGWRWRNVGQREQGRRLQRACLRAQNSAQGEFDALREEPSLNEQLAQMSRENAMELSRMAPPSLKTPSPQGDGVVANSLAHDAGSRPSPADSRVAEEVRQLMAESMRSTGKWTEGEIERCLARGVGDSPTGGQIAHVPGGESPTTGGRITHSEVGELPTTPRTRVPAQHAKHDPQDMDHGHVPCGAMKHGGMGRAPKPMGTMTELEQELWLEVGAVFGDEEWGRFVKTWRLRIEDYPRAVRGAVGEVRMMKAQGRIRTTTGATLNDQFTRFKCDIYGANGGKANGNFTVKRP